MSKWRTMNFNIKFLLLNTAFVASYAFGMEAPDTIVENYENFIRRTSTKQLLKNHSVNPELKQLIDQNLPSGFNHVAAFPWLPEYIMKKDAFRIFGSLYIKACAHQNNCDAVSCPDKFIYSAPNGTQYIIAKKIIPNNKPLSLNQVKQLYKIAKKTGYRDLHNGNIMNTDSGIMYIIDTEASSFCSEYHFVDIKAIVISQLMYMYNSLDFNAGQWLKEKKWAKVLERKKLAARL